MWKQAIIAFICLLIWPSSSFAACAVAEISQVDVTYGVVQWEGAYNTSCLKGFKVCWLHDFTSIESCQMTDAYAKNLTITNTYPCSNVTVKVTAVGEGTNHSATFMGNGTAGLPVISELSALKADRDSIALNWNSLMRYSCFSQIELWICDKENQDLNTCNFNQLESSTTTVQLSNFIFPVCKYFYGIMDTTDGVERSAKTTIQLYINSNNSLTNARVIDVNTNSAILKCQFTILDNDCDIDVLGVDYMDMSNTNAVKSMDFPLKEIGKTGQATLNNLNECTEYYAILSLKGSDNTRKRSVNFVTTKDSGSLILTGVTASKYSITTVKVEWIIPSYANTACLRQLTVSWTSTKESSQNPQAVSASSTVYYIYLKKDVRQTLDIDVDALFLDGTKEKHTTVFEYFPTTNSSNFSAASHLLLILAVISLFSFHRFS